MLTTLQVNLPDGYYFGVSASSAENPDSFEVHKFIVSTTDSHTREEPNKKYAQSTWHQEQANMASQQVHSQQTHKQGSADHSNIPQMLEDVLAGSIRSQADQFADLHNRIQIINNRVAEIHEMVDHIWSTNNEQYTNLMNRIVPIDDRSAATVRNVEKVERTTMEILRDLESKDFKDMIQLIHLTLENSHEGLSRSLPDAMGVAVAKHGPSLTSFFFVAVAVQIMVTGAYVVYKNRRNSQPKKYL
jgi:mannose-binding lectin 1